jgi:hypothetical protein
MSKRKQLLNQFAVELPFLAAVIGMVLVFASVVFFMYADDARRIVAVSLGLFFMLLSVWFASNPFLISTRSNIPLREETQGFLELVRQVAAANRSPDPGDELAEIKVSMLESVDRLTTPGMFPAADEAVSPAEKG